MKSSHSEVQLPRFDRRSAVRLVATFQLQRMEQLLISVLVLQVFSAAIACAVYARTLH